VSWPFWTSQRRRCRVPEQFPLFPVSRRHLDVLTTRIGIMQHAQGARPDPSHGYCTDDVARALLVDVLHYRQLGWLAVAASAHRNVTFLAEAFEGSTGRFRNLRRWDGAWLDLPGSEDANARALQALAEVITSAPAGTVRDDASALFERAFTTASQVNSLRPTATVVLACETVARTRGLEVVADVYERVANDLWHAFAGCEAHTDWPWPEALVTYENELLPQALIVAGRRLRRPRMVEAGSRVLDWLLDAQTDADGGLRTVGNAGWWPRGGEVARYDQQPISTTTLLLAAETAFEATADPRYRDAVESAYGWFLGRNDAHAPVADPTSGAGADGIGPAGVSRNRGAESTLMWLIALEHTRDLRARNAHSTEKSGEAFGAVA
jgi:hypothetical protein